MKLLEVGLKQSLSLEENPHQCGKSEVSPSAAKKSNTHVHEPQIFSSLRQHAKLEKEPRVRELALYTSAKKKEKMTVQRAE